MAHEKLNDSGHGVAAVKIGSAATHDFDGRDGGAWNAVPVDPTAEGIDERDAIGEDEGATGGAAAEAAQRDALRRWIGGAASGAAEKRKAGNLAEDIVSADGGSGVEVFARQQDRADGSFGEAQVGARGRDYDFFFC